MCLCKGTNVHLYTVCTACNYKAADGALIEEAIQQTLADAVAENIAGKALTPFILERLNQVTDGMSLKVNDALCLQRCPLPSALCPLPSALCLQRSRCTRV